MSHSPIDLLRLLGSGVRPDGALVARGRTPVDQADFAELLSRVRAGGVSSGEAVAVAPGVNVTLSGEQLDRLAVAVDAAQAAGKARVLALIDGLALEVDVESRTVTAAHAASDATLVSHVDGVVTIPPVTPRELASLFGAPKSPRAAHAPLAGLSRVANLPLARLIESHNAPRAADAA